MWTAFVPDVAWCESVLIKCVAAIDGAVPVGGEWFRFDDDPFAKSKALDELSSFGAGISRVHLTGPTRFGEKRVGRYRRRRRVP